MGLANNTFLISILLASSMLSVFAHPWWHEPAASPRPHDHHHNHHHHHHSPGPSPAHPPVKPPTLPPVKPPTKPPTLPPVKPPTKPPTLPPTKPPTYPPVKPPTKPPTLPPVKPPTKPPTYPPIKPPTKPPTYPPVSAPPPLPVRQAVAIQGLVRCKSCKNNSRYPLQGSIPLNGATVQLVCKNTAKPLIISTRTDRHGYYFIKPTTISTFGVGKCRVSLVKSSKKWCSIPTNINNGINGGSLLVPTNQTVNKAVLYNAYPLVFEPAKTIKCV